MVRPSCLQLIEKVVEHLSLVERLSLSGRFSAKPTIYFHVLCMIVKIACTKANVATPYNGATMKLSHLGNPLVHINMTASNK